MSINQLRMRSIYNDPSVGNDQGFIPQPTVNPAISGVTNPTGTSLQPDVTDATSQNMGGIQPHHEMFDQLIDTIKNMPTRKPVTGLDKVGLGLSRLAGYSPTGFTPGGDALGIKFNPEEANKAGDIFENQATGYDKQMQDWETKLKAQQIGSNEEQQNNANSRLMQTALSRAAIAEERANTYKEVNDARAIFMQEQTAANKERLDQAEKKLEQTIKESNAKIESLNSRAKTYQEIAKGGHVVKDDKTGQYYMVHNDNTSVPLDITGLSADEIKELKVSQVRETTEAKGTGKKELTPQQIAVAKMNKLTELWNTHPEYKPYIEIDPSTNKFTGRVTMPKKNGDKTIYDSINSELEKIDAKTDSSQYAPNVENMIKQLIDNGHAVNRAGAVKILTDKGVIK